MLLQSSELRQQRRVSSSATTGMEGERLLCAGITTCPSRNMIIREQVLMVMMEVVMVQRLVMAWDLSGLHVQQDRVVHVHVWSSRAFLSVRREDSAVAATCLEAPWPEVTSLSRPSPRSFPEKQTWGSCEEPQSAVGSATDARARLWLLDKGSHLCPAKILLYDLLLLRNHKVLASSIPALGHVTCLVVDHAPMTGPRGYVGAAEATVAVFGLRERRWWLLRLSAQASATLPPPGVVAHDLALGRWWEGALFLTGPHSEWLFSIPLQELRAKPAPPVADSRPPEAELAVRCLGRKLGPSSCMGVDQRGGVLYFLPRDAAVVRWDSHRPLLAEAHAVLLQNSTLLGAARQLWAAPAAVWALVDAPNPKHCVLVKRTT